MKKLMMGLLSLSMLGSAVAADWPARSIKLTVGYGAGGTTDSTARVLASQLEKTLDTKVMVVNKPGGGGSVAAALAKAQKADGYNLFTLTTGAAVLSPHTHSLPYDPRGDFTFIAQYAQWHLGVVVPKDAPYNSLQELLAFAKANPGKISYAISGAGTPQHLTMMRLANAEGIDWKAVAYKGGAAAVTSLLGGHVDVMAGATEWLPQVQSGDFKLLAILTNKRMGQFPSVPTLLDLGYDISAPSILGIAGPKGIAPEVVDKLSKAIEQASKSDELQAIIDKLAMQMSYLDAKAFEADVKKQYTVQGEVIRQAGLAK